MTPLAATMAVEINPINAKGYYTFTLTQAETNADTLLFTAFSGAPGIVVIGAPAVVFTVAPVMVAPTGLDAVIVEGSVTVPQSLRGLNAASLGKVNGANTGTIHIRDVNDTKDRVVATTDASGNRLDIALDLT